MMSHTFSFTSLRRYICSKLLYGTENLIWEILYSLVSKLAFNLIPFFGKCFWKCNQNDPRSSIIVLFLLNSYSWKSITASQLFLEIRSSPWNENFQDINWKREETIYIASSSFTKLSVDFSKWRKYECVANGTFKVHCVSLTQSSLCLSVSVEYSSTRRF